MIRSPKKSVSGLENFLFYVLISRFNSPERPYRPLSAHLSNLRLDLSKAAVSVSNLRLDLSKNEAGLSNKVGKIRINEAARPILITISENPI